MGHLSQLWLIEGNSPCYLLWREEIIELWANSEIIRRARKLRTEYGAVASHFIKWPINALMS